MRAFGWLTGVLLVIIAIGVAITSATAQALPAPTSPTGAALSYVADLQAGNCRAAQGLFPGNIGIVNCPPDPSMMSVTATASPTPDFCQSSACLHTWSVWVTFESDKTGWGTPSFPQPPLRHPQTFRWHLFAAEMANGEFQVVPAVARTDLGADQRTS